MQKCANCGHDNRPGVMYCENCGVGLGGEAPLETKSIDASTEEEKAQLGIEESVLIDVRVQGAALFGENDVLRLDIEGSSDPIILKPEAETIFGRRDPATGAMPDVDLTPFAGYRMGVSRRHAAIRFGDEQLLNLWDLGSSNGTYLNGERLNAHRPYRLHDGDELRLGQMMIRVRFQPPSAEPPPPGEKVEKPATPEAKAEKANEASPAQPVQFEASVYNTPAGPVEKSAVISSDKPPDESKPVEPAPSKEQPVKPAAAVEPTTDQTDGVSTLAPITDVFQRSEIGTEKPEEKAEAPTTRPVDAEQRAELDEQTVPPKEPDPAPTVPPVKPDTESQDKE